MLDSQVLLEAVSWWALIGVIAFVCYARLCQERFGVLIEVILLTLFGPLIWTLWTVMLLSLCIYLLVRIMGDKCRC